MRTTYCTVIIAIAGLMLAACGGTHRQTTGPMPNYSPTQPVQQYNYAQENPGSLFNDAEADYLFTDSRARRVGDIVQVNIVENSKATNSADTQTDRDSSINLGLGSMFNANVLGQTGGMQVTPFLEAQSQAEFQGSGETKRENQVTATVGARVTNILPGNLLQVEGARQIRVNDETQILVVRGVVRPKDIGPDNSVYSTHLADAFIEYYGEGIVAERQKPGWLTRLLDNVWPF